MEGGTIKDFMYCFSFEDIYFVFRGKRYFTTGVEGYGEGNYRVYGCELDDEGNGVLDIIDVECTSIQKCIELFANLPLWGEGKTIYDVESEITWID